METEVPEGVPPAEGRRRPWSDVPARVQTALEDHVGARVVEHSTQPAGFSPGVAARLLFADGQRFFVKALSSDPNPHSAELHRREAAVAEALPPEVPAPRLVWSYDDGDWVMLLFEDVEGTTPSLPWRTGDLRRVLHAVEDLGRLLTPSPIELEPIGPKFEADLSFRRWRRARAGELDAWGLDSWSERNLDRLADLEAGWVEASAGETLLHADIRADNLLLSDNKLWVVDWPHAALGAEWMDLLLFLPSVAMQGGPKAWEIFDQHPTVAGADPSDVDAVLCAFTGMLVVGALAPPPPGLPTVRTFQAAVGRAALEWLKRRLAWS